MGTLSSVAIPTRWPVSDNDRSPNGPLFAGLVASNANCVWSVKTVVGEGVSEKLGLVRVALFPIERSGPGRLSTMARHRGGDWLLDEVEALRAVGSEVIESLLTPSEATELGLGSEPDVATAAGLVVERPGLEPGTLGLGGHRNQCGSVPYRPVASPIGRLNRPFGSLDGYSWTVPDGLGSQMLGGCWVDKPG